MGPAGIRCCSDNLIVGMTIQQGRRDIIHTLCDIHIHQLTSERKDKHTHTHTETAEPTPLCSLLGLNDLFTVVSRSMVMQENRTTKPKKF